jgi:hypothetical protein
MRRETGGDKALCAEMELSCLISVVEGRRDRVGKVMSRATVDRRVLHCIDICGSNCITVVYWSFGERTQV